MTRHRIRGSLVLGLLLVAEHAARACPVCYDAGAPGGLRSYYVSTMLLSALPFGIVSLIAGVAYLLSRRLHETDDAPSALTPR